MLAAKYSPKITIPLLILYLHFFEIVYKECVQTINDYASTIKVHSLFSMTIEIYE